MKIAFVYDVIYPFVKGGVEKRIFELATRLAARGHEVHIYGMKYWPGDDTCVRERVILHGVCPAQPLYFGGKRTIREAIRFGISLVRPLTRERFDIIDCQQFPYLPCIPVRIIAWMRRDILIITWHEVWGDYWMDYLGYTGLFGRAVERFVASFRIPVITVSPSTAERFRLHFGRLPEIVIPNGVDLQHLKTIRSSAEVSDFIFVGRLIREKNADLLLRAFHILLYESPDLHLTLIGDGPEREMLRDLIASLSLEDNVVMTGFIDDHDEILARMKSSKVFVIPSSREGFGIAAIEALGCGLPVVTIHATANAIADRVSEKTGILCQQTPEDLAEGMKTVLARSGEMQDACRASAESFDWDRITDLTERTYASLVDQKNRR